MTLPLPAWVELFCAETFAVIVTGWLRSPGLGEAVRLVEVERAVITSVNDAELARRLLVAAKLAVTG